MFWPAYTQCQQCQSWCDSSRPMLYQIDEVGSTGRFIWLKARALIMALFQSVEVSSPLRNLENQGYRLIDQSGLVDNTFALSSFIDTEWLFFLFSKWYQMLFSISWMKIQKSKISKKRIGVMGKASAVFNKTIDRQKCWFYCELRYKDDSTNFEFVTRTKHQRFCGCNIAKKISKSRK